MSNERDRLDIEVRKVAELEKKLRDEKADFGEFMVKTGKRIAELETELQQWKRTAELLAKESDDFVADRDSQIEKLTADLQQARQDLAEEVKQSKNYAELADHYRSVSAANTALESKLQEAAAALRQLNECGLQCSSCNAILAKALHLV